MLRITTNTNEKPHLLVSSLSVRLLTTNSNKISRILSKAEVFQVTQWD